MRRFRSGSRKIWALLAAGLAVAVLVVLVPWRSGAPVLELVALDDAGLFAPSAAIPASLAERTSTERGAVARVPLLLGVHNSGGSAARPARVDLSVPRPFELKLPGGRSLPVRDTPGSPLVQYRLELPFPEVEPGRVPTILPGVDTLWLELATPAMYCVLLPDSVPEFVPAPEGHAQALSRVQVFYSFTGGDLDGRQAGLLSIQLDPEVLEHDAADAPPTYPSEVIRPAAPMPQIGGLRSSAHRRSVCGPPEEPIEILSTHWETLSGGDFYIIDHGGKARKYLFDLDGNGTIDLEMWDSDGRGLFNTRRRASFPVPEFLRPIRPDPDAMRVPDLAQLPDDSLARLDRFHHARRAEERDRLAARPEPRREDRYSPLALGPRTTARPEPRPAPRERLLGTPVEQPTPAPRPQPPPAPEPAEPEPREPERRAPRLLGEPVDTVPSSPRRR